MDFTRSLETLDNGDFSAIKAKIDNDYQNNQSIWNVFWSKANINVRAESGDVTIMNLDGLSPQTIGSSNYYFNRIRPIGLMLSGYQRRNRKSTIVVPLENGDQATADQFSKLMLNLYKKENVYEKISEAFHQGSIISGMSLLQVYMDYSNDPLNGDIKYRHLHFNEFMIDPFFKEENGDDVEFIRVRSYLSKPAVAAVCPPEWYDRIMTLQGNQQGSTLDGKFQYEAAARGYSMSPKIAYDEYWYRDYRKALKLYDMQTGEGIDVSYRDDLDLERMLAENPQLKLEEKQVPTVRLAIMIQDKVFYDGPNPLSIDCMPFSIMIGYYNKTMPYMYNRFQSVVTSLISPQVLFNRRIILNADFLESTVNTGYMFKQGAMIDTKHLLQTGQGRLIPIKDNYTPLVDVVPIPAPQIPPSAFQQLEILDKELFNVAGLSQENLGKVIEDDSSGYQSALRTAAGLTAQQPLFDRLDLTQTILGNITMEVIQRNWTPGKVKQMLGGEEPAPLFYDKSFGRYHCAVEQGFNTETQKQLEFAQLLELKKLGMPIPDSYVLSKATLQGKDELMKLLDQQAQQQQQMQQQQMEIQQQEIQSRAQYAHARSFAEIATGNERNSRVKTNESMDRERESEAINNRNSAMLNLVKALKELDTIDIGHLSELISLQQVIKGQEAENRAQGSQKEISNS